MIIPGLTSITFRPLEPEAIVELASEAGLKSIEWGGDVHVPHGDTAAAERIRRISEDAGLLLPSYGSYYRVGASEGKGPDFQSVLDSAEALGVHTIRVWAGVSGSETATPEDRAAVVEDLRRIADMAAALGMVVATEYHANTLTDTVESAAQLMSEADHPAALTYWQTPNGTSHEHRLRSLEAALPKLANLHVFHWVATENGNDRRPLAEGEESWKEYLRTAQDTAWDHHALLEFVRGDSQQQLVEDAATLNRCIRAI